MFNDFEVKVNRKKKIIIYLPYSYRKDNLFHQQYQTVSKTGCLSPKNF